MRRKAKDKKRKAVYLEWYDAYSNDDNTSPNDPLDRCLLRTIGWYVSENKDLLRLAMEIGPEDDEFRFEFTVEKVNIKRRRLVWV